MQKQQGFISIIVASVIMIILTLTVLGFSTVMQREQRQALDRQLSSQAFYAAETAVNDVYARLQAGTLTEEEKTECDVTDWPVSGANGRLDPSGDNDDIAYTCVLFDQSPSSIEFNNGGITTQQSKIFPIQSANGGNFQTITFSWSGERGNTNLDWSGNGPCTVQQTLPENQSPLGVPILRVDLVRLPTTATIDRDQLLDTSATFFLYPRSSCGIDNEQYSAYLGTTNKGRVVPVRCSTSAPSGYACEFRLRNMQVNSGLVQPSDRYIARVKSIYNNADLRITATAGDAGASVQFIGAQISVDATGRSNDVLRRINVQLGNPDYPVPEAVLQSMDGVCKSIWISPPSRANYGCF
jgi:hypothetical protein